MIILVTGLDDSGRDEIAEMVLQSYKNILPANTLLKFLDFMPDVGSERSLAKLSKMRDNALAKLEKTLVSSLKKGTNIVMAAGLTVKTIHGYMPVVSEDLADTIKPDIIIFMEILPRRVESYMEHEHIDWTHQRFERQAAGLLSMRAGAPLKIIKVKSGKVKDALKDVADTFRAAMG